MKYLIIFFGILLFLGLLTLWIGKILVDQLTSSKRCDVEKERNDAMLRGEYKKEDFTGVLKEPFSIRNGRNEKLEGEILYCEEPTNRICIACHGWTSNRIGMYKYARAILDNHFHVIVYDHTNCGNSEGSYGTMGAYESEDLSDVVDFAKETFGQDCQIMTYGESMGAATVLLHMTMDERVNAVVADCPFSDLEEECKYIITKKNHLPKFPVYWVADWIFKKRVGFSIRDVSPEKAMRMENGVKNIPLLLIHGDADDFILPKHSERIKAVKKGYVSLIYIVGAKHARSILKNPVEYQNALSKFISDIF